MNFLDRFADVKVLIVGDLMLDRYWWGNVSRISPEAPVPVVNLQKSTFAAGGAANVAVNVAGLGAQAILVGIIGDDEAAADLRRELEIEKVSAENLVVLESRPTTVKTRVIAHSQQVARIDHEITGTLSETEENIVWERVEPLIDQAKIIIISDYAKGLLTDRLLRLMIETAERKNKMLLVDPKGKSYLKYTGASVITPNRKEAAEACNLDEQSQELVEVAGTKLLKELSLKAILITQGEDGMTLFREDSEPFHLNASAREIYDVTGAGDTVIAALAVSLAADMPLEKAAQTANVAAGLVVEQVGTTAIKIEDLRNLGEEVFSF